MQTNSRKAYGLLCFVLGSIATIAVVLTGLNNGPGNGDEVSEPMAREIPLGDIVTTSGQENLQYADGSWQGSGDGRKFVHRFGYHLDKIGSAGFPGASNVFLVNAIGIDDAVSASTRVILGGRGASEPSTLNEPNPRQGGFWLCAFLGFSGSTPPGWIVEQVTVESGVVRMEYIRPKIGAMTMDMHRYFYWVPLGKLQPGIYKLELYDAGLKAVTLMRRVEVPVSK